jgi:phosphatidylglycerophosphate synthase
MVRTTGREPSNVNPANAITASRFLTVPVFFWAIAHREVQIATLAVLICGVFDLFDGWVARKLGCQTAFGAVFDALADGVCYGLMVFCLSIYGWVPWIPVALTVVMGFTNIWMRWRYLKRARRTVNYQSFAMEKMTAYIAYLVGAGVSGFQIPLYYWAYPVMMTIVLAHDTKRMLIDPIDPPPRTGVGTDLAGAA